MYTGAATAFGAIIITFLIIGLVLSLIPAVLAFIVLSRVPPPFQKQTPGLAFLLIIPLFSVIWGFFVHPKVAESLEAYFELFGDKRHGDCGRSLALALCICTACTIVPFFGILSGLAALILFILFYVKAFDLSAAISQPSAVAFSPSLPPLPPVPAPAMPPPLQGVVPPPPPPPAPMAAALPAGGIEGELRKLKEWHEKGLISEAEYQELKQKALATL
jgi:hypothetical protein